MNSYFDDEQTTQQDIKLEKVALLKQEQKIGGLTYSLVVLASLFANFIFSIIVSAVASKLYPDLPLDDIKGEDGVIQEGAISHLRYFQLYRYASFAVIPIFVILAVLAICFFYKRKPADLGLKKSKWIYMLLSIPIFLGLFFGISWINALFTRALGYQQPSIIPNLNGGNFILATLVIAVLPAVVEEIVFRGLILNGLKASGTIFACLVSGLLFSIFHMNPHQTIYQFICGTIFAYIAIKANSILPTMLIHFLNNFVALLNNKFNFLGTGNALIQENSILHIVIIVISCLVLVASLAFLLFKDIKAKREQTIKVEAVKVNKAGFFLYSFVGILGAMSMWVVILVSNIIR